MSKQQVWEPIVGIDSVPEIFCACGDPACATSILVGEDEKTLTIHTGGNVSDGDGKEMIIYLAGNISLCRLVPAPEPAAGEKTARELYKEVMRQVKESLPNPPLSLDTALLIALKFDAVASEWELEEDSDE